MEFRDGAEVRTREGRKIGSVARVVLDPASKQVTHVVVRKGLFLPVDKLVPTERIETADADVVMLRDSEDEIARLPEFVEGHFIPVSETEYPAGGPMGAPIQLYWYPPATGVNFGGSFGPFGAPYAVPLAEPENPAGGKPEHGNLPENERAIRKHARVMSADGEHVGDIERVLTTANSKSATHFVVQRGRFGKERRLIPSAWVDQIDEDEVHLYVGSEQVQALPAYRQEAEPEHAEEHAESARRHRATG